MVDVRRLPVGEEHEIAVTLDELAREGARRMIAAALQAEAAEYVASFFLAWAQTKVDQWAPNDRGAIAYLVEHDEDGFRPRHEFFSAVCERLGYRSPSTLIADYRRDLRDALPAVADEISERLRALAPAAGRSPWSPTAPPTCKRTKLEHLGVLAPLDAYCISGELGVRKPDPRIFEIAAARCGRPLDGAWVIGDGEVDVVGAHRAGIRSVWLHRGRTWPRPDLAPNHVADSLADALVLLESAR